MPRKKAPDPTELITFTFRLERGLRDGFNIACKELDTSSARELRAFMKKFIARHGQDSLF